MSKPGLSDAELLDASQASFDYVQGNFSTLRRKYGNMTIAVRGKKVIASAASIDLLLSDLEVRGIDVGSVLIQRIPSDELALVL